MIDVPFQYKSTVTAQQQEVLQEEGNWRTSETFANTSFVVAESSSAWSLEVRCCCR